MGKPLALMILARDAMVSVCHHETTNLENYVRNADIVGSVTGGQGIIKGSMIKRGGAVDIGIRVLPHKEIVGDKEKNVKIPLEHLND